MKNNIEFYNSISGRKETFKPIDSSQVLLYGCGPTVYDAPHLGNYRTFVFYDLTIRVLELNDFSVKSVINITDIDDKIISRANSEKVAYHKITSKYESIFIDQWKRLNNQLPTHFIRATENISEMISFIENLLSNNFAYVVNGSVYFDSKNSKIDYDKFVSNEEIHEDQNSEKKFQSDFALWKAWKKEDEEIFWDSPWGKGRPAWHTECSVIASNFLGNSIDIHCGGIDLKFPHHQNESVQVEALSKKIFTRYWLHSEHLLLEEDKMSKSLGNILSVQSLEEEFSLESIRLFLMTAHYRSKITFNKNLLIESEKMISKIERFIDNFNLRLDSKKFKNYDFVNEEIDFINALNDDLNTPKALGVFFNFINEFNKKNNSSAGNLKNAEREKAESFINLFNSVFQCLSVGKSNPLSDNIKDLLQTREQARAEKNWELADQVRDSLSNLGWIVEDTPKGQKVIRKK